MSMDFKNILIYVPKMNEDLMVLDDMMVSN